MRGATPSVKSALPPDFVAGASAAAYARFPARRLALLIPLLAMALSAPQEDTLHILSASDISVLTRSLTADVLVRPTLSSFLAVPDSRQLHADDDDCAHAARHLFQLQSGHCARRGSRDPEPCSYRDRDGRAQDALHAFPSHDLEGCTYFGLLLSIRRRLSRGYPPTGLDDCLQGRCGPETWCQGRRPARDDAPVRRDDGKMPCSRQCRRIDRIAHGVRLLPFPLRTLNKYSRSQRRFCSCDPSPRLSHLFSPDHLWYRNSVLLPRPFVLP